MFFFFINWSLLVITLGLTTLLARHWGMGFHLLTGSLVEYLRLFCAAALISLLNVTLGRVLKLLFLPVGCLTFGLSSLFINAFVLEIVNYMKIGIKIENFISALFAAIFISIIHFCLKRVAKMILR